MLRIAAHHRHRVEIRAVTGPGVPRSTVIVRNIALRLSCPSERRHGDPLPPPQILSEAA